MSIKSIFFVSKDDEYEVTNGSAAVKKSINAPQVFLSDMVDNVIEDIFAVYLFLLIYLLLNRTSIRWPNEEYQPLPKERTSTEPDVATDSSRQKGLICLLTVCVVRFVWFTFK